MSKFKQVSTSVVFATVGAMIVAFIGGDLPDVIIIYTIIYYGSLIEQRTMQKP